MRPEKTTKLKVCGITNLEDAQAALTSGADWLGLIAVPHTPRFIDAKSAKMLVEELRETHPSSYMIGVFQNASPEEVEAYASVVRFNAIQLHGQENPVDYAHLGLPLIKVLHLHPQSTMADLQMQMAFFLQQPKVVACLLDLPKGSGLKSILEWPEFNRLPELIENLPCIVAGGLNPDNIGTVLNALAPWGIDIASGVERAPGQKDLQKLNTFCSIVKKSQVQNESAASITPTGEQEICNP